MWPSRPQQDGSVRKSLELPTPPSGRDFLRPSTLLLARIGGFVAERRPKVAVGFSPRRRTKRAGVAERRLADWQVRTLKRRSATRIAATGNRGLKPPATIIKSLRDMCRERSVYGAGLGRFQPVGFQAGGERG